MTSKQFSVFATVCLALSALSFSSPAQAAPFKVGLVFDTGGRGDKSFNDSAYNGLERAKKELGVEFDVIQPSEPTDRENGLRQFANADYDLIIGVGFMFTDDVNRVAAAFPNKHFACVDYAVDAKKAVAANVLGIKFREEEGSFLAGVVAALSSKSKVLGFVGGMDVPLIHKFEAGYKAGAQWADSKTKVLSAYAGVTPDAFRDPGKGKALALSQMDHGADIVYHASGTTGLGVFEAVRMKKVLAIGVDANQYHEAPGFILTSVTKHVDEAVFQAIAQAKAGKFQQGIMELGLKQKGVDYIYDADNKNLISPAARAKAEAARKAIILGTLKVPSH